MATQGQWHLINQVLEKEEMLLVHFNTPMARKGVGYPSDLQFVLANPNIMICGSTFGVDSDPPIPAYPNLDAHAVGMVGLIIDLDQSTVLHGISETDAGSNGHNNCPGLALPPSEQLAEDAAKRGTGHDEWVFTSGLIKGLLVLEPIVVSVADPQSPPARMDIDYDLGDILNDFPGIEIYGIDQHVSFKKFDRSKGLWSACSYTDIMK